MSKSRTGKGRRKHGRDDGKDSLAFKILTEDQTKQFIDINDVDALEFKIVEIAQTTDHAIDLKSGSLLDYFVAGMWWGKEQNFTSEQLSAFYTVLHTLLDNVKEKHMTLADNLREFKKMLAGIGQELGDASGGLECFQLAQAKLISDYFCTSFFQHYKLYEFVTSHTQAEEIIGTDLEVEVPLPADMPWPPPLEEGVTQEMFGDYIATPPPSEAPEGAEKTEEELDEEKKLAEEASKKEDETVVDLLSQLTGDEVKTIMNQVFEEMLTGLKADVVTKLRDKENAFITRINKVHKVAEK